jgi:hypothetical protein
VTMLEISVPCVTVAPIGAEGWVPACAGITTVTVVNASEIR